MIIVSDGWGEGTEVAGVFTEQPTRKDLIKARRQFGAQYARWEKFPLNKVTRSEEDGRLR